MKLTKKLTKELQSILTDFSRANGYIGADKTVVAVRTDVAMMPEHTLSRKSDGAQFAVMQKAYGSDLCGLPSGVKRLTEWLALNGQL